MKATNGKKKTSGSGGAVALWTTGGGEFACVRCEGLGVDFGVSTFSKGVNDRHWFCFECGPTKVVNAAEVR